MTTIVLNGTLRKTSDNTLLELVAGETGHTTDELAAGALALAVARNSLVVARWTWASTPLAEGDEIEILAPLQGG